MTPDLDSVVRCRIFPSIGVARLGNSPSAFFIGPEAPGIPPQPGTFKDAQGRVKRQAARFRVYGYDADDRVVGEVTAEDAEIVWTVHLANKKASFREFKGRYYPDPPLRNASVQGDLPPDERTLLIIDPGPRSIAGRAQGGGPDHSFSTGSIGPLAVPAERGGGLSVAVRSSAAATVPLGEIRTDEAGRLLVLAATGESGSLLDGNPITDYADNDYWYDDTADGPVTAAVTLGSGPAGRTVPVDGRAWCFCAPPHFASDITCITTLYDQMEEVAGLADRPTLSFTRDLWPIFSRVASYRWANQMALLGHGPGRMADFTSPAMAACLADNGDANLSFRDQIFMRIRNPALIPDKRIDDNNSGEQYEPEAEEVADGYYMPPMCGDYGFVGPVERDPTTWLTVTPAQYGWLKRWRDGDFVNDWPALGEAGLPRPRPLDDLPVEEQPGALTRASLERTIGAPFYPGIEMTYIVRDQALYAGPFRFADHLGPGDITRWMALPWQADFFECNTFWWPTARPDDVIPAATYLQTVLSHQNQPGYLLSAATLDELSAQLPPEVVAALSTLVDVPFSTGTDMGWALTYLLGTDSFQRFGSLILEATRQFDLVGALGALEQRRQWARGIGGPNDNPAGDNKLVQHWWELGFVVPVVGPNGQVVQVETERSTSLPETPPHAGTP